MNILQKALLSNGIFSFSTGLSLIIFNKSIAQWFGNDNILVFLILGIGLVFFSFTVLKQVKNPKPKAVFFIIIQDFIWVLASVFILLFQSFDLSVLGFQIIFGVALIVFFFGVAQSIGLSKVDTVAENGMKRLSFERSVLASKIKTWKVISDVSNYHKFAPNVDDVKILSGSKKGMNRSCSHGKNQWTETCSQWNENEQFSFVANTDAKDFPFPLKYLKGTWQVEEISDQQTKIILIFEFSYSLKVYNVLIHPFLKSKFQKICKELLDNWQNKLE